MTLDAIESRVIPLRERTRDLPRPARREFAIESFDRITFNAREEYLVKRLLPRQGVGVLYGASQSLKSFVVFDLALHVALGWPWAGRRVRQASAVYIAAEGAAGLRKRKAGFQAAHTSLPAAVPFGLISSAPNLGAAEGDLPALKAAIESSDIKPGLIVVDTLAQTLGAADENGAGMIAFTANATALANHFRAFVLIVHHVGLSDDRRMRGHSSLLGASDLQILCERPGGELVANLSVLKLKDDAANATFTATLRRVVVGKDEDGDEVSTLVVGSVEEGAAAPPKREGKKPLKLPPAAMTALRALRMAIEEHGAIPSPCKQIPGGVKTATMEQWRENAYKLGVSGSDEPKAKRVAFGRAFDKLKEAGRISVWEDTAWLASSSPEQGTADTERNTL